MPRQLLIAAALAAAMAAASSAYADETPTLDCTLQFDLKGWSAIYERADGTGTVHCSNGGSMPVVIHARGAGLSMGKSEMRGTGTFTRVEAIFDVLGSYAQADVHAGIVKSGTAQALTNGSVSLALVGTGNGYDLGIGVASFTISAAK
ncbi:MAG TPA: hypothetical protein VMU47_08225 [Caldimonas sp.]|nr:hypothetical protein [Caldimonas sp.]